jgi:hypothetical protein
MALDRRRVPVRPLLALAIALAGLAGVFAPATVDAASSYSQDLYRRGDFVRQTNLVQCVGASMQMMINMTETGSADRTASTQLRLENRARSYSDLLSPRPGRKGASIFGWAAALNEQGFGPYVVAGFPTIDDALMAAAHAIRFTGRPVGLLAWAGRHAWVMSGYRATADPRRTQDYRVTGVYVLDPLFPARSSTWGVSPAPNSLLTVTQLGRDFVERRHRSRQIELGGPFVIVMPLATPASTPAGALKAA